MSDRSTDSIGENDLFISDPMQVGKLLATNIGEEVWVPVTPVRNGAFRAVKVEIKDRASVAGYEDKHAIEDWEGDAERLYNRSIETDTKQSKRDTDE